MNIPLDRLYHYLESLIDRDIIIYHWTPHGSRNLSNLRPLQHTPRDFSQYVNPLVVMHDQEWLQYDFYDRKYLLSRRLEQQKIDSFVFTEQSIEFLEKLHLRSELGNSLFPTTIVHSELHSEEVQKYQDHGYLTCYYWAHGLISKDWYRFAQYDLDLFHKFDNIKYDFLIYNRDWTGSREYRLFFSELLVNHSLVESCKTSFSPKCNEIFYLNHNFRNDRFKTQRVDLDHFFQKNSAPPWASADYCNADYNETAIEVVLETVFDDSRWHLTEKSLRPIACGKPFILATSAGCLGYLKNYGFKTFHPLINEQYDSIHDPLERLFAIVTEMKRIQKLSRSQKKELFNELNTISEHNKQRFFSSEFSEQILSEFVINLHRCMEQCNQLASLDALTQRLEFVQKYFDKNASHLLVREYSRVKSIFNSLR